MLKEHESKGREARAIQHFERKFKEKVVAVACSDEHVYICADIPKKKIVSYKDTGKEPENIVWKDAERPLDPIILVPVSILKEKVLAKHPWAKGAPSLRAKVVKIYIAPIEGGEPQEAPMIGIYASTGDRCSALHLFALEAKSTQTENQSARMLNDTVFLRTRYEGMVGQVYQVNQGFPETALLLNAIPAPHREKNRIRIEVVGERTYEETYFGGKHPHNRSFSRLNQANSARALQKRTETLN